MKKVIFNFALSCLLCSGLCSMAAEKKVETIVDEKKPAVDEESKAFKVALKRSLLIKSSLKKNPGYTIVAVNGLCCNTCAIGIGKKVSKVSAVDKKKLPKGVELDRKNGLLTVAVKKGESIDVAKLASAIRDAGYEPTNAYKLGADGKVSDTVIPAKTKK
ncbi:MAG: hypothetical protein COA79_08710 [Planctomycetota bacterium]|nr:MAG: hypothetical protein COA79_08710 [Planctomycetota bacterium]